MTTATYDGPSSAEVEMLMRAAARIPSPREHGQEQARRSTSTLVRSLAAVATVVAVYDAGLLVTAV